MAMNIQCNNKGCYKEGHPKLHKDKNEVICEHCNKPITSVTHFTKVSLQTIGQIYRGPEKSQKAFTVLCQQCNKQDTPVVQKGELFCRHCHGQHNHLSGPYKQMLVGQLGNNSR